MTWLTNRTFTVREHGNCCHNYDCIIIIMVKFIVHLGCALHLKGTQSLNTGLCFVFFERVFLLVSIQLVKSVDLL